MVFIPALHRSLAVALFNFEGTPDYIAGSGAVPFEVSQPLQSAVGRAIRPIISACGQ
jgi:hypothetical protein